MAKAARRLTKSEQNHQLGYALDLLERLPLRVSPHADEWLRNALGEPGPATARISPVGEGTRWPIQDEAVDEAVTVRGE